ncbi:MAG: UDP-N-acetylglucosamine--N-acetylmuramyl-(pentapeptide) pyrophosphoryl-undecaprenol N-acetylglucosamine transferase, partial [Pseudomonadota bacterium]|nr:UDP-N-acetylglucosamine--N-acetylmuramyl-(pentapeptide) pyrophosphoryl-undecaprenol N-acetylglucosamine transferase [Pseudomonadota bacterium]
LTQGVLLARRLIRRIRPRVVIGFGGYPTVPPLLAAALAGMPTAIHEQNAVMGRANRLLAPRVLQIATGFATAQRLGRRLAAKAVHVGNPVRPAVLAVAGEAYRALEADGPMRLLVFGGSQGARVMSEVVPQALARLDPALRARLRVVQQARSEDLDQVRRLYAGHGIKAELAPFFADLPERLAAAHLVISRAGASTVAELAAVGRPAILVPLPHALDQDQRFNAEALAGVGGAIVRLQDGFTPEWLAAELTGLFSNPGRLSVMAAAARTIGTPDAAERLADLVLSLAAPEQRIKERTA